MKIKFFTNPKTIKRKIHRGPSLPDKERITNLSAIFLEEIWNYNELVVDSYENYGFSNKHKILFQVCSCCTFYQVLFTVRRRRATPWVDKIWFYNTTDIWSNCTSASVWWPTTTISHTSTTSLTHSTTTSPPPMHHRHRHTCHLQRNRGYRPW